METNNKNVFINIYLQMELVWNLKISSLSIKTTSTHTQTNMSRIIENTNVYITVHCADSFTVDYKIIILLLISLLL